MLTIQIRSIKSASVLQKLGRLEEAIRLYEEGIRSAPCLEFYVNIGALQISSKRPGLAIEPLENAIELASDCIAALVNLAGAYSMLGNHAEALASYCKALEIEPGNPEILKRLSAFLESLATFGAVVARHRSRVPVATTVVTTIATPREWWVYEGRHIGSQAQTTRPHPDSLPVGEGTNAANGTRSEPATLSPNLGPLPIGEGTKRIALVSPHCVMDFANGAATATRDALALLATQGFACEAFCGTRVDEPHQSPIEQSLGRLGVKYVVRNARIGPFRGRMIFTSTSTGHGGVAVTMVETDTGAKGDSPIFANTKIGTVPREEIAAFLTGCELFLNKNRPDVVLTYGGDPVALAVQQMAKRRGIPILFALHNFAYADRAAFALADYIIVGGEFSRRYYREKLGLDCHVLPYIVHWQEAEVKGGKGPHRDPLPASEGTPLYVTFINPQAIKGVYVFARIARELARRRPDISLLVTQGRSRGDALKNPALGLAPHLLGQFPIEPTSDGRNISTMPFTPDPRDFYPAVFANTKMLLMPSLWCESFGLVAAEAMLNGIPVLASDRGALPETLAEAGFLFDIPARYRPETREVPTAEEVAPWVETIIRLWDDAEYYEQSSRAARERAQQWHPDRLALLYRDFFSRIIHQRGPPPAPDIVADG